MRVNNSAPSRFKQHGLTIFLVLTFVISWTSSLLDMPLVFVFSPSIVGIILVRTTYDREKRRDFWRRIVDFKRISVSWYLLIVLLFPTLLAISIFLDGLLGGTIPAFPNLARIAEQPYLVPLLILEVLVRGPLSEELGWRGFALETALSKWGILRSGLMIGVFWWAWHLPLFSWSTYGSAHYQWGWFTPMFWGFLLNVIALSLLMTWTYRQNRASILSAILLHFFFNLTLGLALPFSENVFLFLGILLFLTVMLDRKSVV